MLPSGQQDDASEAAAGTVLENKEDSKACSRSLILFSLDKVESCFLSGNSDCRRFRDKQANGMLLEERDCS